MAMAPADMSIPPAIRYNTQPAVAAANTPGSAYAYGYGT